MNKNNDLNSFTEDEIEFKRVVEQGNKLKWTWIIGVLAIIVCILYGDAAQWLLAVFIAIYIFITTNNYLKSVSANNS